MSMYSLLMTARVTHALPYWNKNYYYVLNYVICTFKTNSYFPPNSLIYYFFNRMQNVKKHTRAFKNKGVISHLLLHANPGKLFTRY